MSITNPDPIIVHTARDVHTLACPLCDFTVDVPDVPVSDALGAVFGMSGDTFARVHAENSAKQVSREMHDHLKDHTVTQWLTALAKANPDAVTCQLCNRPRTPLDGDYSPLQVINGQPIGWSSDDDGEVCGNCMTKLVRGQL